MSQAGPLNELANPSIPTQFTTDAGIAIPAANNLNIFGGAGITTSGGGDTVVISLSGAVGSTITGNSGGPVSPTAGNWNTLGSGSITTVGTPGTSTMTFQLTGLTNHAVLVGAGTSTITKVGPVATSGSFLASQGVALDPVFSTATYPLTTTINKILYSSASNTVSEITAGNDGVLISSNTGVPSWLPAGTTGQILIATTGAPPSWGSAAAAGAIITITGDSGGAESPTAGGNFNILGTGSITTVGSANTETVQLTGLTNHAVLIGAGTATITKVGPVASTGAVLMSNGLVSDPGFSTATYPATTTINQILYSSANNVIGGITASNNGVLISGTTGIPSWLAAGTTGQVLIATTGSPPSWGSAASAGSVLTITGDSGGAESPTVGGNFNILGSGSITTVGSANTETIQLTGLTNHAVLVGAGTSTITKVGPSASTGQILQNNAAADPSYSTATYPSTTTINQILYSSAANTVTGLATANSAVLVTNSTGVPAWSGTMTNGQLIIGSTGATPTAATLTAGAGISITNAAAAITIAATSAIAPGVTNIGIAYSAGTFTVQGADGTALSASNPGYVTLQSKGTPGQLKTITVTANQTFTDGSSGGIDNARFGVTTGVNWAQDMPFFLYAVMDDTEALIAFMISRNPCATLSPASTGISKSGSIINVNQADFFCLASVTLTSYDQNPCLCIGSFRMQFAGATDSYTVQTLNNTDGIGNFNDNVVFTFPSGQNGAASGTYILSNAGTEPVWTGAWVYTIQRNGLVKYNFNGQTCTTTGVGAQTLQPVLPYAVSSTNQEDSIFGRIASSGTNLAIIVAVNSSSSAVSTIFITNNASAVTNATITIAATSTTQFLAFYRAFNNLGL